MLTFITILMEHCIYLIYKHYFDKQAKNYITPHFLTIYLFSIYFLSIYPRHLEDSSDSYKYWFIISKSLVLQTLPELHLWKNTIGKLSCIYFLQSHSKSLKVTFKTPIFLCKLDYMFLDTHSHPSPHNHWNNTHCFLIILEKASGQDIVPQQLYERFKCKIVWVTLI